MCSSSKHIRYNFASPEVLKVRCKEHEDCLPKTARVRACAKCRLIKRLKRNILNAYGSMCRASIKSGHATDITLEHYWLMMRNLKCFYCHGALVFVNGSHAFYLDKMIPEAGYRLANVVPCCTLCNWTKMANLTVAEQLLIAAMRSEDDAAASALLKEAHLFAEYGQYAASAPWAYVDRTRKAQQHNLDQWKKTPAAKLLIVKT